MFNKIKDILNDGIENGDFPGGNFCLIENNRIKCAYLGYKKIVPKKEKLVSNEIYDIASLSKIIVTTTLIFRLIERNMITLKTQVKDILKEYLHDTTILELLLHTSGLAPVVQNSYEIKTKEELINQIYCEKMTYEPFSKIVYSDTGYILLGFIIERVVGDTIDKIAEKEIFVPLKMTKTSYFPIKELCAPTELVEDTLLQGIVHDERGRILGGLSGHAGVFSTAEDISKYILSILNDDLVMSNKNKELIFDTTLISKNMQDEIVSRTLGYQKFSFLPEHYNDLITHTGFTGCNMWIDRNEKRGFVLLTNAIHPKRENNNIFKYRMKILNLFYKEEVKK
ncbi:serine hydrolase domain-containing protein [Haploplasma axanthum]|nr:serine hydrolase domain-containing protein [Haploplasma axanthum]